MTTPVSGKLGILVGGGPAPGINGVICAATIEAINQGLEVIGFLEGFKWLAKGDSTHCPLLTIDGVKAIALRGGSILGTARTNPAESETALGNVLDVLRRLQVTCLVTIGGDELFLPVKCTSTAAEPYAWLTFPRQLTTTSHYPAPG